MQKKVKNLSYLKAPVLRVLNTSISEFVFEFINAYEKAPTESISLIIRLSQSTELIEDVERIPVIMGETDVIKTQFQYL